MRHGQQVQVERASQLRRDLSIHSSIEQIEAGVDEVGLSFFLAATKSGVQAEALIQRDARARQTNSLPIPEADIAPGELHVVEDAVETAGDVVIRIAIAGRVK